MLAMTKLNMPRQQSYLQNLKFDPHLARSFKAKYLSNIRIVILLILFITVVGISSFIQLPRRLNPEVKIPIVSVITVLAGASPQDVEKLVTNPLEEAVNGVANKTDINSVSGESVSNITIQFTSGTDPERAKQDVQSAINSVTTLPSDAQIPSVRTFDFENQPVWIFALKTKADEATLARFADQIQSNLKQDSRIERVEVSGIDTQEFQIFIKPNTMSQYEVNIQQIMSTIKAGIKSYPGGNVDTARASFPIGIDAYAENLDDLRHTPLSLGGQQVKLGDIAQIAEKAVPNATQAYYADARFPAQKVVTFSVFKTKSANITNAADAAKKVVSDTIKPYKNDFEIIAVQDTAGLVNKQFNDLLSNFQDTIILVFITFLVFLGIRQALIVSLTIPLTFLSAFSVMYYAGLSINFLSLFSLLLSLGLLVDDSIVIITGITSYYKTGKFSPGQAGILVWRDFIIPIWSTTITTVWAFIPLLIATGIIGEFIKTIPIVVAATLYSSTAIAVLITLPLMMVALRLQIPKRVRILLKILVAAVLLAIFFPIVQGNPAMPFIFIIYIWLIVTTYRLRNKIRNGIKGKFSLQKRRLYGNYFSNFINRGIIDLEAVGARYKVVIHRILISRHGKRNTLIALVIFTVFAYLLVPFGFVVNEFFPKSNQNILFISVELPAGTKLDKTNIEAERLANEIRKISGINYVTAQVGQGINESRSSISTGNNTILITLNLPDVEKQKIGSTDLAQRLRTRYANYTNGKIAVVEESGGPPAGADIQIRISGDDLQKLDQYAGQIQSFLASQQGIINIDKSIKPGVSKVTFVPDLTKLSQNGLTTDIVGFSLRNYSSGVKVASVKFGNSEKSQDITIRQFRQNPTPEDLGQLSVATPQGEQIPLLSLGVISIKANPTQITHYNTKRTITVSAGVAKGYSVTRTNAALEKYANSLNLSQGYSWTTGGVNEENQKSINSIFQAMIAAGILIFATMVIQFTSYRQAILVMLVIPIAISGVLVIFALTGTPLSFPALIGILSLFGIVVTQAMVLVDRINLNRRAGLPFEDSISDAAAARLEPIFLGSFTTIVGLIPVSISNPLWRGLGGAIIAGLSFSIFIMLFFIPVTYFLWFEEKHR